MRTLSFGEVLAAFEKPHHRPILVHKKPKCPAMTRAGIIRAPNMDVSAERADELIRLSAGLLLRFGRDIEADNGLIRCLVIEGFVVATYPEEPDLTIYRILHLDDEQNILHLFAAARHRDSTSTDLRLCRDGPWEKTFRKIGTEI